MVEADEIPSLDEVPILAVAAAVAEGTTGSADVGELRVKESDRLAGRWSWSGPSGRGRGRGRRPVDRRGRAGRCAAGTVRRPGDHRMAMAAAVAGAACPSRPSDHHHRLGVVATSYPGFADDLGAG